MTIAPRLPVLDRIGEASIQDVKGRVENVRFEAGQIVATLRISDPAALAAIERGDVTGGQHRLSRDQVAGLVRCHRAARPNRHRLGIGGSLACRHSRRPKSPYQECYLAQDVNTAPDAATLETRAAIRSIATTAGLDSAWADSPDRLWRGCDRSPQRAPLKR